MHEVHPTGTIPLELMRRHLEAGEARALLRSSAPPVHYAGCWWAIPESATADEYVVIADAAGSAALDAMAARLALAAAR